MGIGRSDARWEGWEAGLEKGRVVGHEERFGYG